MRYQYYITILYDHIDVALKVLPIGQVLRQLRSRYAN